MIVRVGLEVADGREEHLVPDAQENPATTLQVLQPGFLVLDAKAECPAVGPDDVIKRALNLASQQISILFQQ